MDARTGTSTWFVARLAFARVLLAHGASVELGHTDRHGKIIETPLHYACWNSCISAARLLLAHGASFDKYSGPGLLWSPLSLVRDFDKGSLWRRPRVVRELNELFDAYLQHYWRLRVKLRLFGSLSEHLLGHARAGQFGAVNRVVGAWDVYRRYPFTICGGVLIAAAPFIMSKGN
jgi:hypothetical protein